MFNGHVHASSTFGNILNVGSITTHSFADSPEGYPKCYLFDTITQEIKEFSNINCPLFRKIKIDTLQELQNYLGNSVNGSVWKYVLHIDCNFDVKDGVENSLQNNNAILNYKVTTKSIKQEGVESTPTEINLESNLDVKQSFKDFLNTGVELRYPMNLYNEVIGETQKQEVIVEKENQVQDVIINDKFANMSSTNTVNTLF